MKLSTLIDLLNLQPHPEGGYFCETYRAAEVIPATGLPERYQAARAMSTAIYFLLTGDTFSAFHRLQSDEIWHFYGGTAIQAHLLHPDGRYEAFLIGSDLTAGHYPQAVFPAGCWFAARVTATDGYGLVGCTVAPGFDFADFELADRDRLTSTFPQHAALIASLTRV